MTRTTKRKDAGRKTKHVPETDTQAPTRMRAAVSAAPNMAVWVRTLGGVAQWSEAGTGERWFSPVKTMDGATTRPPNARVGHAPELVATSADDIDLVEGVEVARFHINLCPAGIPGTVKLTDASARKIRVERAKAGGDAWSDFDYETQECVILRPARVLTLAAWIKENGQREGISL